MKYIIGIENISAQSFVSTSSLYDLPAVIDSSWVPLQTIPTANGSQEVVPKLKNCQNANTEGNTIALVPNNAITQAIKSQLEIGYANMGAEPSLNLDPSKISFMFFDTRQALMDYINGPNFSVTTDSFCFAVVFNNSQGAGKYNYELMFNLTADNPDFVDPTLSAIDPLSIEDIDDALIAYYSSGYLTLQSIINNLLVQDTYSDSNAYIEMNIQSVHIPAYTLNYAAKYSVDTKTGDIFLGFPMVWPFLRFIAYLIEDKERRVKEGMMMMGMSETAFFLSFFVFYLIIFTIIDCFSSLLIVYLLLTDTTYILYLVWYWLFTLSLMAIAYFCSAFFSRVRPAVIFSLIVFLVLFLLKTVVDVDTISRSQKMVMSFFSPLSNLFFGQQIILSLASIDRGLTKDTLQTEYNNFSISDCIHFSIASTFFYFVLGAYIEKVWPRQYGVRKHPLFFLNWGFSTCSKRRSQESGRITPSYQEENENYEPVDAALKLQDKNKESLIIRNIRKVYSNKKVAVDRVSMTMYKGQIFCLLGHNGAGKTSLISVLTGLYAPTEGHASIFGMNIRDDMDRIRKRLGVCPQHDILFPKLTVKEHLRLFSTFKGMKTNIEEEVNKIIKDLDLWDKRDDLAKNLSGGQKRRLSIGIALIGNSDIILLDEPSSGMDTSARRSLWEMLKNYKNDRIIILTTHFMDEADFLGDRIGIMGGGKLITCGRSLFLKNKFGIGYNLSLVKKDPLIPSAPIIEVIRKYVPEANILSNVSAEIRMQLPSNTTPKFSGLFQEMDTLKESLGISGYGISVTTLEEVFLKVAEIGHSSSNPISKSNVPPKTSNLIVEGVPVVSENNSNIPESVALKVDSTAEDDNDHERIEGRFKLFGAHFLALLLKKLHYFKRDKRAFCLEIFLPVLIMIFGLILMQKAFSPLQAGMVSLDPFSLWPQPVNVMYNKFLPNSAAVSSNLVSMLGKNVTLKSSDAFTLTAFDADIQSNSMSFNPSLRMAYFIESEDATLHQWAFTALVNTTAIQAAPLSINYMSNAILQQQDSSNYINHVLTSFPRTVVQNQVDNGVIDGTVAIYIFTLAVCFIGANLSYVIVKEIECNAKHQQIVSGVSISAYWLSSYLIDLLKYLLPGIIGPVLVYAFKISSLKDDGCWSAIWALFLLFGTANISFVYMLSFLCKTAGGAQIATFFANLMIGLIGANTLGILRLSSNTYQAAKIVAWIIRIFPIFCFANGMFVASSRQAIASAEGWSTPKSPIDIQLAGGDILFLGLDTIGYLAIVFIIEYLKSKQINLNKVFKQELKVKYEPKVYDDDVETENLLVQKSSDDKYALKVKEIRKVYMLDSKKHKVAVEKISFGVEKGEVLALLGVNGAGKTTTFKIMSGEIPATSGNVYIKGCDITKDMKKVQKFIGYCPQFDALLDNLTSKEHLELFAAIKGIPRNKRKQLVDQKIKEVGLEPFKNIPAGTYSGGNKRKLSFAIATLGNPLIVFLDEPSTGMDPESRRFIWKVISNISTKRKMSSIVLTTHSMEEAEALSTRIAIQVDGMFKCLGSSQHIKNKFGGGYEMEFKLTPPDNSLTKKTLEQLNLDENDIINKQQMANILSKMQAEWISSGLTQKGFGSAILKEIDEGTLKARLLVEFVLIEINGETLRKFLQDSFGEIYLIEHFQSFYRFKVVTKVGIGSLFGKIEEQLKNLNIAQYSIGQTTIEQIFNMFAERKLPAANNASQKAPTVILSETAAFKDG